MGILASLMSSAVRLSGITSRVTRYRPVLGSTTSRSSAETPAAQHMMLFSESAQFELLLVFGVRFFESALLVGELWNISCLSKYVDVLEN